MTTVHTARPETPRAVRLEQATIAYNAAEGVIASIVGITLTATSVVLMPLLARRQRQVGLQMGSQILVADAAETRLCAWLSVSTFVGLAAFAIAGWTWIDSAGGFVIAAFALKEGREAWRGEIVCDDGCDG